MSAARDVADRRPWQAEPEPEPEAPPPAVSPVALAVELLHAIAEDPLLRPSYRTAARRHLRRLEGGD